jgi:eukaryotic-like serine/threonine-protein kinase
VACDPGIIAAHVTLSSGTALGPYSIVAPIGAGGMGEVYRARDNRLDRSVAIKILPPALASGTMRARFEREAKAISALTHPNICAVYDVGNHDGVEYLVLEYLEGETLADRLARGPLPLSQVVRYGSEIAQALHHAHRRGITHRDLKPGNVMLTASGAKLLDFGLAKLMEPSGEMASETLTRKELITAEGTVVGTLPYMSPEHVEGRTVDHRSDIFSLGVMLYEMATGGRPFTGGSQAAVIASILSTDPPTQSSMPPALDRIIRTALEKNPDERWQSAQDVARQLRWISESSSPVAVGPSRSKRRLVLPLALVGAVLAAGAAGWAIGARKRPVAMNASRFSVLVPSELRLTEHPEFPAVAISPDSRTVAFQAWSGKESAIYIRSLDSTEVKRVEGTAGAAGPFWSSDSQWLGFTAAGKLWKTKPRGGSPQVLCAIPSNGANASWQGDTILFSERPGTRTAIYRVSASGGEPVAVTKLDTSRREWRHAAPHLLEDGKHFLYLSMIDGSIDRALILASLDGPLRKQLVTNTSFARTAGDRLLYVRGGTLISQRFTTADGAVGEPTALAQHIRSFYPTGIASFDVSRDGTVVYTSDTTTGRLTLFDRRGAEIREFEHDGVPYVLDVSPDGRRAAVTMNSAGGALDIWLYDVRRGLRDRITGEEGVETHPAFTPDGKAVVYSVGMGSMPRLVLRTLSAPTASPVGAQGQFQIGASVAPDGKSVYHSVRGHQTKQDIVRTALGPNTRSVTVIASKADESNPAISPDGRFLAYMSDITGAGEIYVGDLSTGDRVRVSTHGGYLARWNGDGSELYYVSTDNRIMAVKPGANRRWDEVSVAELFQTAMDVGGIDALPDGQSFVISQWKAGAADAHLHVISGW